MSANDLVSGSAEHTLDLLKAVVGEITAAGEKSAGKTLAGEKLVASLTNTMTDRAATKTKFNNLLAAYREEVLTATKEGWADMSDCEKKAMAKLFINLKKKFLVCYP